MARIEKQQFRNDSGGFIGAVLIGPKGDEKGIPVAPGDTVWLSEEEQILTANAPRLAADNPFVKWTRRVMNDETGQWEDQEFTPLVMVHESRPVPANFRPIPADISDAQATREAMAAASGDTPEVATTAEVGAAARHAEVAAMGEKTKPHEQPRVPRRAAAAAAAQEDLPMKDALEQQAAENAPHEPPAAPTPPGAREETAAAVDPAVGEETGAAVPPTADAPEGEYRAHEEVGTPDAPAQAKPWTPGAKG